MNDLRKLKLSGKVEAGDAQAEEQALEPKTVEVAAADDQTGTGNADGLDERSAGTQGAGLQSAGEEDLPCIEEVQSSASGLVAESGPREADELTERGPVEPEQEAVEPGASDADALAQSGGFAEGGEVEVAVGAADEGVGESGVAQGADDGGPEAPGTAVDGSLDLSRGQDCQPEIPGHPGPQTRDQEAPEAPTNVEEPVEEQLPQGINERIEYWCKLSLNKLGKLDDAVGNRIAELERANGHLKGSVEDLESQLSCIRMERDELRGMLQSTQQEASQEIGKLRPYATLLEGSFPEGMSLERLVELAGDGAGERGADARRARIAWRVMPALIQIVEETGREEIDPKVLASVAERFSEATCDLFGDDEESIARWHKEANGYLASKEYSFVVLVKGAPIDVDLMTGSIQGSSKVGSIKRMPLKRGDVVLRKADVSGV